jgi:hypothetical protein
MTAVTNNSCYIYVIYKITHAWQAGTAQHICNNSTSCASCTQTTVIGVKLSLWHTTTLLLMFDL